MKFYLCILGSLLVGMATGISILTILGLIKVFKSKTVGYFNCGIGLAGLVSVIILLFIKLGKIPAS